MRIDAIEGELLAPEITILAKSLKDPESRDRYLALRDAVVDGEVPEEQLEALGTLLEISLESGRIRHFYGADGEQTLIKLFRRTPAGRALSSAAEEVSGSLRALQGQVVEEVKVSTLGPGSYSLTIDTDRCQLSLRIDRGGVRVENVAVGI
jgi:hypothetical protein